MHDIDRTNPPAYKKPEQIDYVKANSRELPNGIPLYTINTGNEDFVRLDVVFSAGTRYQTAPLIARFANIMLPEGTTRLKSEEISEKLDYYGAYLEQSTSPDFAELTLVTPNKYFKQTFGILQEILLEPGFPREEFELKVKNKKQAFLVRSQKVDFLSRKAFNEGVMANHPYGRMAEAEDYERLSLEAVKAFYQAYYRPENCRIILSGKIKNEQLKQIERNLGRLRASNQPAEEHAPWLEPSAPFKKYVHKPDAWQSSLRIGKVMFNKLHPDYQDMQILITLLGGFFGSRLMSNLREDKGYTYGVGAFTNPMQLGGYFLIKAEVGKDVDRKAADEIYKELKRLREEPVSTSEIDLVTSYFRGQLMRLFNGVFSLPMSLRGIIDFGLDYSYYDNYFKKLEEFTPEKAQYLAEKYLHENAMTEVIAGDNKQAGT